MISTVKIVKNLRKSVNAWRSEGLRIGLVPTMGALHDGHLSLVREALKYSNQVVVSIFVNPTQFGPNEDFEKYPRQEEKDCQFLAEAGANLVFIPSVGEMYPEGDSTTVQVSGLTERLEGPFRPGHFRGVATVVTKLLFQCTPDIAVFGEKDYQQLCLIRRMVRDLSIPVEIIGSPIIRDSYGLALSSRNAYLSEKNLKTARLLNKVLFTLTKEIRANPDQSRELCDSGINELLESGFEAVDYLELVDSDTLEPLENLDRPARLVVTARIQGVRLLDNMPVNILNGLLNKSA